jgi:hypothetical protein
MPVQVNELVVRATVENTAAPVQKNAAAPMGKSEGAAPDVMVAACVEEVLRILHEQHKR